MSLEPLLSAPFVIQIHAFGAMAAFALGVVQFVAPKGTLPHRALGFVWIILMTTIATSSIFIRPALFPGLPITQWFSFIHLFTILTYYGVAQGVFLLLRGGFSIESSRKSISGHLYWRLGNCGSLLPFCRGASCMPFFLVHNGRPTVHTKWWVS